MRETLRKLTRGLTVVVTVMTLDGPTFFLTYLLVIKWTFIGKLGFMRLCIESSILCRKWSWPLGALLHLLLWRPRIGERNRSIRQLRVVRTLILLSLLLCICLVVALKVLMSLVTTLAASGWGIALTTGPGIVSVDYRAILGVSGPVVLVRPSRRKIPTLHVRY